MKLSLLRQKLCYYWLTQIPSCYWYSPHTTTVINCNLIQKKYKILLTSGIYTFLWIIVICFLINKITTISIAADMIHYKQNFVSKKIFLNGLTELEYQYLLFIVISIYLESSFNVVVIFCCCHRSYCCCHRPDVICHC